MYLQKVGMRELVCILYIVYTELRFAGRIGTAYSRLESLSTARVADLSAR